jgi:hypothetical protein
MTRRTLALLGAAMLLVGCNKTTSEAPATNPAKPGETRRLAVTSPGEQDVTRNETETITVRVDRDNFAGPLSVEFRNLPKGVSVVTPDMTIPAGRDSLEVAVKADKDAAVVDDHKVQIAVKAKDQKDLPEAVVQFDMDVEAD